MDLLIDIGNTNLRWAGFEPGQPQAQRIAGPGWQRRPRRDEARAEAGATAVAPGPRPHGDTGLGEVHTLRHHGALPIDLLAAWDALPAPSQVLVGNVGGTELGQRLTQATRSLWGLEPRFAAPQAEGFGVRVAYPDPGRLGVDRWLALIAAHHLVQGPALIVDAGTAITYDLLLADGEHLGGLILPGVHLLRQALASGTRIPPWAERPEPGPEDPPWAADTAGAIAGASLQAPAALAERLWGRLRDIAGAEPQCLLTGGDGERLAPLIRGPAADPAGSPTGIQPRLLPALVLQGLALLA